LSRLAPCTPADIVNKLCAAIHEGLKSQASQSVLSRIGLLPRPRSPKVFSEHIGSEAARWSAAVKLAGIKSE